VKKGDSYKNLNESYLLTFEHLNPYIEGQQILVHFSMRALYPPDVSPQKKQFLSTPLYF